MEDKKISAKQKRMMEEDLYEKEIAEAMFDRCIEQRYYEQYEKDLYDRYHNNIKGS